MDVRIYTKVILNVCIKLRKFPDCFDKHLRKKYGARPTHNFES